MTLALVVAFDARQTIFGALTNKRRDLVVRILDDAKLRKAARMHVEVRGGPINVDQVVGSKLSITLQPEASGPDGWRGWMQFNDVTQVAEVPIMRAIRHVREASARALIQYERGGATIRLDLADPPPDRMAFVVDLRAQLVKNQIVATLSLEEHAEPLEAWNPRALILP